MAKMNKGPKANVSWVKPAEPSFLKKFKNDVGFKEGPTIDTKRLEMPALEDDSGSDREDELPQVVILKKGDLSAEEVLQIKEVKDGTEKDKTPADGKILFKKPTKRSSDKFQGITASSNKKKKSEGKSEGGDEEKKEEKSEKKVKNKSLLSFGEDEDED
uniref:KIAA1143 homolog n=1 Tax=Salmo salar TaxID=8030 RepID=B9EPI9_SALSA|nr:KIAA1143 homolog [Salmo salar]